MTRLPCMFPVLSLLKKSLSESNLEIEYGVAIHQLYDSLLKTQSDAFLIATSGSENIISEGGYLNWCLVITTKLTNIEKDALDRSFAA